MSHTLKLQFVVLGLSLLVCTFESDNAMAEFSTVINSPPTIIGSFQNVGEGTQLNIFDNGSIGVGFDAGPGSQVNIYDGKVGSFFTAFGGSEVNIAGGEVSTIFSAEDGSIVNISGGVIDLGFDAESGSQVTIEGGTILSSFEAKPGSLVNLNGGSMGPFFNPESFSQVSIRGGTIGDNLRVDAGANVSLYGGNFRLNGAPIAGLQNPGDTHSLSLPNDFLLTGVLADGTPFAFASYNDDDQIADNTIALYETALPPIGQAAINVPIDDVGFGLRNGQTLTIETGGVIRDQFNAGVGSSLVVNGGLIGENLEIVDAMLEVNSGTVGEAFDAFGQSMVIVNGGQIGRDATAHPGSKVIVEGGSIGISLSLNDAELTLRRGTVGGGLTVENGSTVDVYGGTLGRFDAFAGTEVNIHGGEVRAPSLVDGAVVNLEGGTIFGPITIRFDGTLNLREGRVSNLLQVGVGIVNQSGGHSGSSVNVFSQGVMNISGGTVGGNFRNSGEVNLSGGVFFGDVSAFSGSVTNITGVNFLIDGQEILGIVSGEWFTVSDRHVTLSGMLLNGEEFSFDLNDDSGTLEDFFASDATVRILLIPEPNALSVAAIGLFGILAFRPQCEDRRGKFRAAETDCGGRDLCSRAILATKA